MACTDVQTIQAGNGTKTQFSFDFPYIFKSEIHVYFWNAATKEYDEKLTTDATYPWRITDANPTIVEFTGTAPPSPATPVDPNEPTVDNVKIRRITKVDDIRALFNPGSAIRSDDLNKNFEQLRYAVQESNCQGIPDDVDAYLKNYYWNKFDSTVYSTETWDSDDDQVATTQAIDARIDSKIDSALTVDIIGADGINITDDTPGSGQITVGLSDNSVDFDKIKDADQIKLADQVADYDNGGSDDKVFTSVAAIRRFENFVQDSTPSTTAGIGKGRVWVDVADDKTLSVWDGNNWVAITSGGTFSNQPKVVYVDATSGSDANDGHRISRPKKTIKAAVNQINADSTYGDGSVVIVAAGVYQEAAPIQIQKKNVSIIGQALRSCIVHPTVATQGDQSAGNHALFELNSGSFIQNLTLTGMKAGSSGTNTVDSVLPAAQGWNFAFYAGATITKSPYIQNCTNFSDSEIDNSNLNANTPAGGLAGDTDSAPTGGGMLVDGSVVATASPLRSMVADSYTHVGLNGPGILVTNNGYCQATSSYAFFNKYHIKTLNGGQANLAASTTDFGDLALVADGKSTAAIFTSNVDGAAADGDISFNINEPTAGVGWFGDTERPASNMLVEVNSVIYPILSATANTDTEGGAGWTVTISRPDPNNRSNNLGLNGAVADNLAVSFYLRSMIASSGHTMEYVGSGTDYRALPENGGVPNEAKQITESNNGKVWTAITDHNGKFKIGGNQTDDPIFEVDQQLGFVTIPAGSIAFKLLSDLTPQLGGNLDVNGNTITSTSNANVVLDPNGTGTVDVSTSRITSVTDPTGAQDAATKNYVDTNFVADAGGTMSGELAMGANKISGVSDPTASQDAATKNYVDSNFVADAGGTMSGALAMGTNKITGLGDPTAAQDAATKNYTDTTFMPLAGGTFTGNVTFNSGQTIDGYVSFTTSTGSANLPVGTTSERDASPAAGMIRYNSETGAFEGYSTTWGEIGGDGGDADTLEGLTSSQFLRSDQSDSSSGTITAPTFAVTNGGSFTDATGDYGSVKLTGGSTGGYKGYAIEDGAVFMQSAAGSLFGLYDDTNNHWALYHTKNAETRLYYDGGEKIRTTSGGIDVTGGIDVDGGSVLPVTDNLGAVGTSSRTWNNGHFTNMTVDSTLSVRGAIDLADNDILRLGDGDDAELFCNGSHLYLDLNSGIGNFYIRDGTTNRFTFDDNGTLTASTFSQGGVLNGIKTATAGLTGTYAFCTVQNNTADQAANFTTSGSNLRYSNANGNGSGTPGGSWRLMGRIAGNTSNASPQETSLFLRYA